VIIPCDVLSRHVVSIVRCFLLYLYNGRGLSVSRLNDQRTSGGGVMMVLER
jgi:hypothetical protein